MTIEKKTITAQAGYDHLGITNFLTALEDANKEGFFVDRGGKNEFCGKRYGAGYYSITLVKGEEGVSQGIEVDASEEEAPLGEDAVIVEETPLQVEESSDTMATLETLTKKVELLEYAKAHNFEVPEHIKQPAAIKKWMQKQGAV